MAVSGLLLAAIYLALVLQFRNAVKPLVVFVALPCVPRVMGVSGLATVILDKNVDRDPHQKTITPRAFFPDARSAKACGASSIL